MLDRSCPVSRGRDQPDKPTGHAPPSWQVSLVSRGRIHLDGDRVLGTRPTRTAREERRDEDGGWTWRPKPEPQLVIHRQAWALGVAPGWPLP